LHGTSLALWMFDIRCWCGRPRDGFRDIFRALWRRGARFAARRHGEVFLRARRRGQEGVGGARSAARRHGKVLLSARRSGQEGIARRSSLRRAPVGEGAHRRARARRRTICSPARCSACRRGRRRGGLQDHNPASWRCVPRCVSAWARARWPE